MQYPSIKVFSPEIALLGEIDLYTSLRFKRSWQGVGDFEVHCVGKYDILTPGNIIMLDNDGHRVGVIRAVKITSSHKGVESVVSGVHLNGLTSQRIVLPDEDEASGGYFCWPKKTGGTITPAPAETILKAFVSSQRPSFAVDINHHRGATTVWMSRYDQVDSVLQEIAEYTDIGWEIYLNLSRRKLIFDVIPGVDRSASQSQNSRVIMAQEYDSIDNIVYNMDMSTYRNVAYAGGAGEDYNRTVIAVTNEDSMPHEFSINRFETFIDCGTLELAETDESLSLQDEGKHKLLDHKKTESLTATISQSSSFIYGRDWNLGDLVTVADHGIGLQQEMRVAEVEECYEPTTMRINVTFGTAAPHIGRVIRSYQPKIK